MRIIDVNSKVSTFAIGRRSENEATQVRFDYIELFQDTFGPGVCELLVQRPGEEEPYAVPLTLDGGKVIWTISDTDTDIPGRTGKAELQYYVGKTVAKSCVWMVTVLPSLSAPSETPPEKFKGWVEQIVQIGAETKENAAAVELAKTAAADSADNAAASASAANTAKTGAQTAQSAIENMTASVETLPPGTEATVEKTSADGVVNLKFGIPAGAQGPEPTSVVLYSMGNGISVIDAGLSYTRGVVEVRKIGSILWLIDSGVYNFTENFAAAKNRTVLQFDLPKALSNKIANVNGVYGTTGTVGYFPALAYENVTYTTFNCQSYLKRSAIGDEFDTYQLVYTGLGAVSGGGLCGFHLKMPLFLTDAEE